MTTAPRWRTVAVFSRGIAAIPHIAALLGADRVALRPVRPRDIDAVVGWGEKRNTKIAQMWALFAGVPYWRAEDGFVRSVGLGVTGDPPLSIVLDDLGMYYDARGPSRLEQMLAADDSALDEAASNRVDASDLARQGSASNRINTSEARYHRLDDPALLARASSAIKRIIAAGISKYNNAPTTPVDLGPVRKRVLVVDQTFGDLAIACGLADATTFERMLAAAIAEHPDAEIIVKTHPDVLAGKKRGYLERAAGSRVRLWAEPATPAALLSQVTHVYVVSSQLGFEAVLAGVPVTCFGVPWYAGWGVTDDRATGAAAQAAFARRSRKRTREQLFAAAYLRYARYVDPDTGARCELERVIDHLELQRRQFARNTGTIFCFGFQFWKQSYIRAYLKSPGNTIIFARSAAAAERLGFSSKSRALVWGQREKAEVRELAARYGVELWRMEDGFLRSVGLGSDLVWPASLVVDRRGIYYDPSRPSELEEILQTTAFTTDELARAAAVRVQIVATRISKYNVGADDALSVPTGRRVILVPGQSEKDASIVLGCKDVRTNLGLLAAARAAAPDAFIVFKPHPDVLSGNRTGAVAVSEARAYCDHVEVHASLAACLDVADEIHTMTSLVGFEGLLRGKRVVVHGQPFYAGWGLTEDRNPPSRRTRALSLDELCAGTLLHYPRYMNRATGQFTSPEVVIDLLRIARASASSERAIQLPWPVRKARQLVQLARGMRP